MKFISLILLVMTFNVRATTVYCEGWPENDDKKEVRKIDGEVINEYSDKITIQAKVRGRPSEDGFYILKKAQCQVITEANPAQVDEKHTVEKTVVAEEGPSITLNEEQSKKMDLVDLYKKELKPVVEPEIVQKPIAPSEHIQSPIETKTAKTEVPNKIPKIKPSGYASKGMTFAYFVLISIIPMLMILGLYLMNRRGSK